MSDDSWSFVVGLVVGLVLALLACGITHDVTDRAWKREAVITGHAENVTYGADGATDWQWKDHYDDAH